MKPRIDIHIKKFWFNLGWYPGEEFILFKLCLFETIQGMRIVDMLTIFDIQILKFLLAFGVYL